MGRDQEIIEQDSRPTPMQEIIDPSVFKVPLKRSGPQWRNVGVVLCPSDSDLGLSVDSVTDGPCLLQEWFASPGRKDPRARPLKKNDVIVAIEGGGKRGYSTDKNTMIGMMSCLEKDF